MYEKIFQSFENAGNDNAAPSRRRFPRRANDICVLSIGENTYPVHDWSLCGVLMEADGRYFKPGQTLEATIRFRTSESITDIPLYAKVIRSDKKRVAFEFKDLPQATEHSLGRIIEMYDHDALATEMA